MWDVPWMQILSGTRRSWLTCLSWTMQSCLTSSMPRTGAPLPLKPFECNVADPAMWTPSVNTWHGKSVCNPVRLGTLKPGMGITARPGSRSALISSPQCTAGTTSRRSRVELASDGVCNVTSSREQCESDAQHLTQTEHACRVGESLVQVPFAMDAVVFAMTLPGESLPGRLYTTSGLGASQLKPIILRGCWDARKYTHHASLVVVAVLQGCWKMLHFPHHHRAVSDRVCRLEASCFCDCRHWQRRPLHGCGDHSRHPAVPHHSMGPQKHLEAQLRLQVSHAQGLRRTHASICLHTRRGLLGMTHGGHATSGNFGG